MKRIEAVRPPFKRPNGEKFNVADHPSAPGGLRFGDFDLSAPRVGIVLDGETRTLSENGSYRTSIGREVTKHIESPVDFYRESLHKGVGVGVIYLDPVAHQGLLSAAGGLEARCRTPAFCSMRPTACTISTAASAT